MFLSILDIPSDIEPSGDGVDGLPNGFSPEDGEDIKGWSVKAIVGAAFPLGEPDEPDPRAGMRPPENLEVVDRRDAREPGRKGDGNPGA